METFVVRAWRSGGDASTGDDVLRGVVEHVASGRTMPFRDVEQLITFLRSPDGGDVAGT
jgi:hypothetical protein